jgi:peptidyl-prolyl cis-trans isomerase C
VTENRKQTNHRAARRVALVASVSAALSLPLLMTQSLHGQTGTAAGQKSAVPAPAPLASPGGAPTTSTSKFDPSTVIASAGDVKVTAGDFDAALSTQPPQQQQAILSSPEARKSFVDYLFKMKAVAAEAEKRGIEKDPKVQQQLAIARQNILVQNLLVSVGTDEAGNRKYFDQHPEQFGKVQARHILVSTRGSQDPAKKNQPPLTDEQAKKKADDIRARLVKGEDFAAIAKAESDDPGSKDTGGTYTFGRNEMVPAFEQAAYSLKVNEISQPVKTQFGYHVIQLQKHLPGTFDDAKQQVPAARVDAFIKELVGDVKFNDAFLNAGPVNPTTNAAAAPAPAPAPAPAAPPAKK